MKKLLIPFFAISSLISCFEYSDNALTQTLEHDGIEREYVLYVPEAYDGSFDVPLMLNFHGFGGDASDYMNWADMRSVADAENFILVYPQGTILDGYPHWNAGLDTDENKSSADDFGFVETLIDELSSAYNIDEDRVYATGYSNGAFFSYSLACFHGDKIAAIGSVSGTMMAETYDNCSPSHPTAIINIHGTSDSTVPYDGGTGLMSVDKVLEYWIEVNQTSLTPTIRTQNNYGTTIEHHSFTDGNENTAVEHYKIIDGDHVWFDINYEGSDTGRLIWDFVSRYDINGLRE
jgi:polyhydroxybutyrate depolymerase